MKFKKIYLALLIVFFLSLGLRFWKITDYPVHLTIDEVTIGYSSYSILNTAKDEHGSFLPLAFESAGDWKSPILVYLMAPFIHFFGLNELGVRLPIAILGTLTPLVVFFLIKKLTKNDWLAIITAFSLAISPWHIHFSRGSFEAILGLFLVLMGTWIFLEALDSKDKLLILSAVFFALSIYAYHAEKIFTPLFVLALGIIYRQKLLKFKKSLIISLIIGALIISPMVLMMFGPQGQTRALMTFISQDVEISKELHPVGQKLSFLENVFDNNFLILGNFWLKRYFNYWDPVFLFFKGMGLTQPNIPGIGLFHLVEFCFFVFGLGLLIFRKDILEKKARSLIFVWLILGPLAASLANNDQHALRSLTLIPAPQLLVALGFYQFWKSFVSKRQVRKIIFSLVIVGSILISLVYYLDLYYVHYPIQFSENYHYGFKELSLYAWENYDDYDQIVVDYQFGSLGPFTTGVPHYYMLFYGQYDPADYQQRPDLNANDFDKFSFRPVYWPKDRRLKNTLFMASPWSLPTEDIKEDQIIKEVYFKNGHLGFLVVKSEG